MTRRRRPVSTNPVGPAPERMVLGAALDVADLPSYAFGPRSVLWWATMGVIAIEGTVFVMMLATYFYLRSQSADMWPLGVQPPVLTWGTLNTVILVLSVLPNHWAKRAARRHDLATVRIALTLALAFAVAFLVVRVFEFMGLNCRWDTNAYGSAVWTLLGLHTVHLVTDFADSVVLAALLFLGPLENKRFVDVFENAVYWDFVVVAWLPIYAVIYWAPRF
jgi:heme/copper-type cytochrome/quinol oxidase subunit 3